MKIKTMLLIGSGISIILVLIFSLMVYMSFNKVAEENERELIAQEIHKTVSELDIFLYEYLTYREERMLQQWNLEYDNTAEIMEKIKIAEEEWKTIKSNYADLKDLFSQITMNYEKQGSSELEDRLVTQFLIKSQSIISDSSKIAKEAYDNAIEAQKTANNSMLISLIVLFAALIGVSLYTAKRITNPLEKLTKGTEIIGKGNLKHKIDIKSKDEIGELTVAFNKMTGDLKKSYEKLKELDVLKTRFLSTTSHELRTPMTPMKIQLELLLDNHFGKLSEKQKQSLEMVLRNTKHLDKLIADILDISRIQAGRLKFELKKVQVAECIKKSIENLKMLADQKNIIITSKITELPELTLDKDRIIQVLNNLIKNAIKFTPAKGKIIVEAEKQKDNVLVKVKDTGIGMSEENLKGIFEPFFQIDSSYKREYEGTGLGLAISKGIVEQHRGNIWAKSEIKKGSTFYFTLPLTVKIQKLNKKEVKNKS